MAKIKQKPIQFDFKIFNNSLNIFEGNKKKGGQALPFSINVIYKL